jgi:endonuclease/exonuclease/phosphatase (EEP) superfamily protein YafD
MPSSRESLTGDPPQSAIHSCFSLAVIAFSLLPLCLFAFSLLGRYFFLAELINNFRCQIMLLLLPFALLLLLFRQWWLAILYAFATAWSMVGIVWIFFPDAQPPPGATTIKFMSFNVLDTNPTPPLALARILEHDADVVTVVEFANDWPEVLLPLHDKYPYRLLQPRHHGFGIAFFSKLPLSDIRVHQLGEDETDCPMIVSTITVGEQKIRLAGMHVFSPTNRLRMDLRNRLLSEAAQILSLSNDPTIVMGDFNCTPWSPFLSDFVAATGYRDSRQGFGYQATWHKDLGIFKIPIDHAFISDSIHVHNRFVATAAGSDHLPIVFEVSVSPD